MLELLDKVALFIAAFIIGYLTYTTLEQKKGFENEGKDMPAITKKMLNPEFIEPNDAASPSGRDPFEVDWDSYITRALQEALLADSAATTSASASISGSLFDNPAMLNPSEFQLMAILTGTDGKNSALISGQVFEQGSVIGGDDPETNWTIKKIGQHEVVITSGDEKRILKIYENSAQNEFEEIEDSDDIEIYDEELDEDEY